MKKQAAQAAPRVPVSPQKSEAGKVKYEKLDLKHRYSGTHPWKGTPTKPLTASEAASSALLWLETESEWAERVAKEEGIKGDVKKLGLRLPSDKVLFTDPATGERVICWNNLHNRPFSLTDCEAYEQDILTRNWAGPTVFPGETVNGETITISRTGQIVSGQKRLVALWRAKQRWDREEKWQEFWPREEWPDGPVMDALIVLGVSDDSRVLQTVDNTQPRTAADTFFTGTVPEQVLGAEAASASRKDRLEVCRMLQAAVDFLWKRVGRKEIKTNRSAQVFAEANPALLKSVGKTFALNRGRTISLLRLSPGQSAAQLWLAAASQTDQSTWDGTESTLDLSAQDQAEAFWEVLTSGEGWLNKAVGEATSKLTDLSSEGEGQANAAAKCAVLAAAWLTWEAGQECSADELLPRVEKDEYGLPRLTDVPTFGGIDLG
jgi:hypothetical protein